MPVRYQWVGVGDGMSGRGVSPVRAFMKDGVTAMARYTPHRAVLRTALLILRWLRGGTVVSVGVRGSGHAQFLDVLHRSHAGVEDRVRTNKAMGLDNLPSASWEVNRGWMLAANLAADLDAWVRLLALHDIDGLPDAEPDTMRFRLYHLPARLYHLPARLADHARRRWLRIERT